MPLEKGGRSDKFGNRYEIECAIYEILKVVAEKSYSVTIEALGDDEKGTDILVHKKDGKKEHKQCKVRNGSKEHWSLSDLRSRRVVEAWKYQLNRDHNIIVEMVSPIGCSYLVDLHSRALNTDENTDRFYDVQVKGSDQKFVKFYEEFCMQMGLDYNDKADVKKSVDLLKRIKFNQISEHFLSESIFNLIGFHFSNDSHVVYNALVKFVVDEDILGHEITVTKLMEYLNSQRIHQRFIDCDQRVLPHITVVNEEFRSNFSPIQGALFEREEFEECINAIEQEKHLIISGNAGFGKSGCVEAILNYCEKEKIPHVAIKLDRRTPHKNCEIWGKELGFSSSIVYALHSVSKNEQAVILLDQLDALRWTQSKSSEALDVCMELIKQVSQLNGDREKKISIVFVCRSYDLSNDRRIKALFEKNDDDICSRETWERVVVDVLNEEVVSRVVGEKYSLLTPKTKKLLKIPSNLYIWQHLDKKDECYDCATASRLIDKWFDQICKSAIEAGVSEQVLIDTRDEIVKNADKLGKVFVPKTIIKSGLIGVDYLISSEMIVSDGVRIGFTHQSILDYFISTQMTCQFYDGICIEKIVGNKNRQTPGRKYQVQMFMQNLLEYDCNDFLRVGLELLESDEIRYYIKFIFYELLSQIENPDKSVEDFVIKYCDHETYGDFLFNNVFYGKYRYVSLLMKKGVLDRWMKDFEKKKNVFSLLSSISEHLADEEICFIKKYAFKNREDDEQFSRCFYHGINEESDALFGLRLQFYEIYPEWTSHLYIDVKKSFSLCENRVIDIISFLLVDGSSDRSKKISSYDELFDNGNSFTVNNGPYIVEKLLPHIPTGNYFEVDYFKWSAQYTFGNSVKRFAVEIIKKANESIIKKDPALFWHYYEPYMGKGYAVFDEIILAGLKSLPESESNRVIEYLSDDLDKRIFDKTSSANSSLSLAMETIEKHTKYCDEECVATLEKNIQKYISPQAIEWYKDRIGYNKSNSGVTVYWSYWGDLQYQLLQSICYDKMSEESRNLLEVLKRRFGEKTYRYSRSDGHSGIVVSPVSKKSIGRRQWLQILTNRKLKTRKKHGWKEVEGGFVESSLEMYASDFHSAVKMDPEEMIRMVIDNRSSILPIFINSLFSGAEFSERISDVSKETWEDMFRYFPCDMESQRASYFCGILEKTEIYDWSYDILNQLKDISSNYVGDRRDEDEINAMDSTDLVSASLNHTRGSSAKAMGHLLWHNDELLNVFKDSIEKMTADSNSAVRMASMFALWPAYNIDRDWAEKHLLCIYESDIRMAAYNGSKDMLFLLYEKYRDNVLKVVLDCFNSDDKRLIEVGGNALCEFHLRHDEFADIIAQADTLNEEQIKAILHMAIIYLGQEIYREKAKSIILNLKNTEVDVEFPLSRMFYDNLVDADRDSEFLIEIMKSNVNRRTVHAFVHYLEENAYSINDYASIIISLCENILSLDAKEISNRWGIEDNISKLIISLYDECVEAEKDIAEKCLDLWDIMFEKQIGQVRRLSRELMER